MSDNALGARLLTLVLAYAIALMGWGIFVTRHGGMLKVRRALLWAPVWVYPFFALGALLLARNAGALSWVMIGGAAGGLLLVVVYLKMGIALAQRQSPR